MFERSKDDTQIIFSFELRNPQRPPYTPLFDCKDLHRIGRARISNLKNFRSYRGKARAVSEFLRVKRGAIITDADGPGRVTVVRKTESIKPATCNYRENRVNEYDRTNC